jgi:predicted DNA-binding protein
VYPVPPSSSAAALERVNLNLPSEARDKLRSLAKTAGQPEGVYARELLLSALAQAEAAEFRRRLEASRSPARRERDRQIASALERLRG